MLLVQEGECYLNLRNALYLHRGFFDVMPFIGGSFDIASFYKRRPSDSRKGSFPFSCQLSPVKLACMYVCMYVCINVMQCNVCMYVCMYVCVCVYIYM